MNAHLFAAFLLSGAIGAALGALGGGGSILAVPVLVYVAGLSASEAVTLSLAIVGTTSLLAGWAQHQSGKARLGVALPFAGSSVVGALAGARLTQLVSERALMLAFAAMTIVVGSWMLRTKGSTTTGPATRRPAAAMVVGAAVGVLTGFLGVGGGFLVVPALMAFVGLQMDEAIGTSLLVIAINSAAGLIGHLGTTPLDLGIAIPFVAISTAGALAGARIARRVSLAGLRRTFAVFVIAVGAVVSAAAF